MLFAYCFILKWKYETPAANFQSFFSVKEMEEKNLLILAVVLGYKINKSRKGKRKGKNEFGRLAGYTKIQLKEHTTGYYTSIVTRNNIVWKLARGYCLCYCKTFSLVPDSTECTNFFYRSVQYIICTT